MVDWGRPTPSENTVPFWATPPFFGVLSCPCCGMVLYLHKMLLCMLFLLTIDADLLDTFRHIISQPLLPPEVTCLRKTLYRVNILAALPNHQIASHIFLTLLMSAIPYSTVVLRVRPTESGCESNEKFYVLVGYYSTAGCMWNLHLTGWQQWSGSQGFCLSDSEHLLCSGYS